MLSQNMGGISDHLSSRDKLVWLFARALEHDALHVSSLDKINVSYVMSYSRFEVICLQIKKNMELVMLSRNQYIEFNPTRWLN